MKSHRFVLNNHIEHEISKKKGLSSYFFYGKTLAFISENKYCTIRFKDYLEKI